MNLSKSALPISPSSASRLAGLVLTFLLAAGSAHAQLSSYPTSATDIVGSTGSAAVALSVPDYFFVNDSGLGFGGTNTDVFSAGETAEFVFGTPLLNHPTQHDLLISAFVGGLGATDNATVRVETSSNGSTFSIIGTFSTEDARSIPPPNQLENDFEAVKHFSIEFGATDNVTHVRLTNIGGTSEGLRLDAIEGLHPVVNGSHAFEVRLERVRQDIPSRFSVRIKNIGDPTTGVGIREWIMDRPDDFTRLEDTVFTLLSTDGDFICVENCIFDNNPDRIPFSRHAWSTDGSTEAAAGLGMEPGRQASLPRYQSFDTDGDGIQYLDDFEFSVVFTDGIVHTFTYNDDVMQEIGSLYNKYQYFSSTPIVSTNRPVDYYQFVSNGAAPVPSMSPTFLALLTLLALTAGLLLQRRASTDSATN